MKVSAARSAPNTAYGLDETAPDARPADPARPRCLATGLLPNFCNHFVMSNLTASGGGRTHNLWLRRPTLYPVELRMRLRGREDRKGANLRPQGYSARAKWPARRG
jgi:hypothetical protein